MSEQKQRHWQQKLSESRRDLLAFLESLPADAWTTPVFSEGEPWTIKTVVSHLIDSERGMSIQVHKIRKGEETVPPDFDITRWNSGVQKRIGDLAPAELLAALVTIRAKTVDVMNSLQPAEWALTGRHPARGIITVEQYYETIHAHELAHLADLQKAFSAA